jgi:hypothetical protein
LRKKANLKSPVRNITSARPLALTEILQRRIYNYLRAPELHISLEKECCSYLHPSFAPVCVRAKLQSADLMLDAGCRAERKYDAAIAHIYK